MARRAAAFERVLDLAIANVSPPEFLQLAGHPLRRHVLYRIRRPEAPD